MTFVGRSAGGLCWRAHAVWAVLFTVSALPARAAHPFVTDDTNTQGRGKFELELGTQYTRTDVETVTVSNFQFAPQLSYGVADALDVILRPTYNTNVVSGGTSGRTSGFGDTNIEFKWRFWQHGPSSVALVAGTGFPSGNFARGLDSGQTTPHAYVLVGETAPPVQLYANVGAIRNIDSPAARDWLGHASAVAIWMVRDGLKLGLDVAADQNPLRAASQWPTVVLVGAIYTLSPAWDVDAGYQRGLNHSAPQNQFLVGATLRW